MSKITFLSTAHPYRGGIAAFNETLAKHLIDRGEDVCIVNFSLQYPSFLFPGKSQYSLSEPPKGITITREVNSINPFNWIKVGLKLRKERADMIFLRYWTPFLSPALSTIARIAKGNKHTKIVALADNITPHEKLPFQTILTKYFVKSCDRFMVMSNEVGADLGNFKPVTKPLFHPHPVYDNYGSRVSREEAIEELGLDKNFRYALFFGFIRPYKGLNLLLDAWAKVAIEDRFKDVKLIIAGEYYCDPSIYLEQIEKLNLQDKIVMVDKFISDERVKYFFSASECVIQPYLTATQSGITQIAYNFDTPMIVTRVGGLSEIVFDKITGYVAEVDTLDVAKAIYKMFAEGKSSELSANMCKYKDRFSWKSFTDLLLGMLEEK